MNTEVSRKNGQQEPSRSTPDETPTGEHEGVTTSSGIRFSLPSWAEPDSPAQPSPEPRQTVTAMPFEVQYF